MMALESHAYQFKINGFLLLSMLIVIVMRFDEEEHTECVRLQVLTSVGGNELHSAEQPLTGSAAGGDGHSDGPAARAMGKSASATSTN